MLLVTDASYHCSHSVVVLGMFDGVHIGHQVLLQKGRVLADRQQVPLVVCTFSNHPLDVIAPEKAPKLLTTLEERAKLMEKMGVDVLVASAFSQKTMNIPPADYVGYLVQRFHPSDVICGYNHSFGQKGEGKPALLEAIGGSLGFRTWVVPQITLDGMDVSSTEIRKNLSMGKVQLTQKMLGRAYSLQGSMVNGCFLADETRKQMLPDGKYRCIAEGKNWTLPCLARVSAGSIFLGQLPEEKNVNLSFLSEIK